LAAIAHKFLLVLSGIGVEPVPYRKHCETRLAGPGQPEYVILKTQSSVIPADYRPVGEILSLIGDKWTVLVVLQLVAGKRRFNELRRQVQGISQKMLAATLKSLEREGLVKRTFFPIIPPRVEYELTELGWQLLVALKAVRDFALEKRPQIEASRARFDAEAGRPASF
jgi:DNA-binding HxlR family transcriptional regulator